VTVGHKKSAVKPCMDSRDIWGSAEMPASAAVPKLGTSIYSVHENLVPTVYFALAASYEGNL